MISAPLSGKVLGRGGLEGIWVIDAKRKKVEAYGRAAVGESSEGCE
jgi:hypothetical protein